MLKAELNVGEWGQVVVSVKGRPRYVWGWKALEEGAKMFQLPV